MRRLLLVLIGITFLCEAAEVELLRDKWGVPHVFAASEADGFFGVGYAAAEDRLVQMELLRRRGAGRLSEVLGAQYVELDRQFRLAGMSRHAAEAFAQLPAEMRTWLRAYAAGVNAYAAAHPEVVRRRFASLGFHPEPWRPADSLLTLMSLGDLFDKLYDEQAVAARREFDRLVSEMGEQKALEHRRIVLDDETAIVPEHEMARDKAAYARLKARAPSPSFVPANALDTALRFSHAWILGGGRTTTGKPILESDPQVPVTNPALWYEFHLSAGRFDVRGISIPGCPGLMIGWNRRVGWGITALGAGATVTFIDKLSEDARGYLYRNRVEPFERRLEHIGVKGAAPVIQEVLTNRHGFVFNSVMKDRRPGEAYVSYYKETHDKGTSVRALLQRMYARNWSEFRAALEHYYVPGAHTLYGDVDGNIGYHTVSHIPLTKRSRRIALEGWTGEDEVLGRVPFDEMPHLYNPAEGFISHANNLPVGAWYPYDLGIASTGAGARAWRLRQLLEGDRKFSVESLESIVHRDDVQAAVASLLPTARKVASEDAAADPAVRAILSAVEGWDFRIQTSGAAHAAAKALTRATAPAFQKARLEARFGRGDAGVCHLGRLLAARFAKDGATPREPEVRRFLVDWLRAAHAGVTPAKGDMPGVMTLAWQQSERAQLPALDERFTVKSPRLSCDETQTIWSQNGNSYTQIVDFAEIDRSRSVLPPGVSEDPESPFFASQMEIWARGTTHPAPLSRKKVEAITVSRRKLQPRTYDGPDAGAERLAEPTGTAGAQFIPALPGR